MKTYFLTALFSLFCFDSIAQSVGIGTTSPDASALLEINTKTKGLLMPRMLKAQKNVIPSPGTGLLLFQNGPDSVGFHYYNGSRWEWIQSASNLDTLKWSTTGNAGTNAGLHFIGTRDNVPLVFKINNQAAGKIDTSGSVSIGRGTLAYNPGSKRITAIGDSALYNNSFGSASLFTALDNTAVGEKALFGNTTGSQNTGIGKQVLYKSSNKTDNTAMGYKALENVNTSFNTAVGSTAANQLTTGTYTTAIGYNAAYNTTTGSGTTALGYVAGYANTTGTANTAIGFFSNFGAPALTNATAIGAYATVNTSNSLVLGSNARVGIGTSSPTATLHVQKMPTTDSGIVFQGTQNASVFLAHGEENVLIQPGKDGSEVIINPTPGGKIRLGGLTQNNTIEVAGKLFANEMGGVVTGGFNIIPMGIISYIVKEDDDYLTSNAYGSYTNTMGLLGQSFQAIGESSILSDYVGCYITLSPAVMTGYSNYFITGVVNFSGFGASGDGYAVSSEMELQAPLTGGNPTNNYRVKIIYSVDDFPNIGTCKVYGTFMVYGIR